MRVPPEPVKTNRTRLSGKSGGSILLVDGRSRTPQTMHRRFLASLEVCGQPTVTFRHERFGSFLPGRGDDARPAGWVDPPPLTMPKGWGSRGRPTTRQKAN